MWKDNGAYIYYNINGGRVGVGTADPDYEFDVVGAINTSGNLTVGGKCGIGTSSPQTQLHISSKTDAIFRLEADSDNTNESDNPQIQLYQDAGKNLKNMLVRIVTII